MKLEEAVTIVGPELRLASKLLHTANPAACNSPVTALTDLRSALMRFGHQTVQSATDGICYLPMNNATSLRSIAQPSNELWKYSIAAASIAKAVARRTTLALDEAFLTGFVHGVGRLKIIARAPGQTSLPKNGIFYGTDVGWHRASVELCDRF